jgi:hypothetical protein
MPWDIPEECPGRARRTTLEVILGVMPAVGVAEAETDRTVDPK